MRRAAISAPTPCWGHPSSTVTIRLVFFTLFTINSLSNGLMDLKLITSALMPYSFSFSAAYKEYLTILAKATIVTSVPTLSMCPFPIGRV